eukprot:293855-Chlamydomonas_euryale.AAC.1
MDGPDGCTDGLTDGCVERWAQRWRRGKMGAEMEAWCGGVASRRGRLLSAAASAGQGQCLVAHLYELAILSDSTGMRKGGGVRPKVGSTGMRKGGLRPKAGSAGMRRVE